VKEAVYLVAKNSYRMCIPRVIFEKPQRNKGKKVFFVMGKYFNMQQCYRLCYVLGDEPLKMWSSAMSTIDAMIKHDGHPPFVWAVEIKHAFKDNCHVFTSDKIPGLLVASRSLEKAIAQLPVVIKELVKRNKGFECDVTLGGNSAPGEKIDQPDVAVITEKAA
jgi:hypothetical protein